MTRVHQRGRDFWFDGERRTTRHVLGAATVFVTQQRRKSNKNSGAAPSHRKFSPHPPPPPKKAAKLRTIFYCRHLLLPASCMQRMFLSSPKRIIYLFSLLHTLHIPERKCDYLLHCFFNQDNFWVRFVIQIVLDCCIVMYVGLGTVI